MLEQLERAQAELAQATDKHTHASEAKKKARKDKAPDADVKALFAVEKAADTKKKEAKKRVDELTKQFNEGAGKPLILPKEARKDRSGL